MYRMEITIASICDFRKNAKQTVNDTKKILGQFLEISIQGRWVKISIDLYGILDKTIYSLL